MVVNAMPSPRVVSIHIARTKAAPMERLDAVSAVPGSGLDGDRYAESRGTFSKPDRRDLEVTLIEIEAIQALARDYQIEIAPHEARRNLVTECVALNHLVGRTFQVGTVTLEGMKLCEPCGHLEALTGKKLKAGLTHRGGLRARIVEGGVIHAGDVVRTAPSGEEP
jgi:MOSC domain-containing protein YiiM